MKDAGRMATTVGVIAALMLALAALMTSVRMMSHAEAAKPEVDSGIAARQRSVRVTGTAAVRAKPDVAVVTLGYESRALTARPARVENDEVMKRVLAAVEELGVERKDIQTVEYRLFPLWENWPKPTVRSLCWHVLHMVEIRVRQPETVADVIDAASAAGADKMNDVKFWVNDLHQLRGQAREMAAQVAREKAEQLASLMGARLGEVVSINDTTSRYGWQSGRHVQFQSQMVAEEPMEVSPDSVVSGGQIVVQVTEEVVFALD